jgi:uncharacterized protein (DUF2384 family)
MSKAFTTRFNAPRLSPDQAARQGRVTRMAIDAFGSSGTAIAFLNTHLDTLNARPLDLAVESKEGLAAVEALLSKFQ